MTANKAHAATQDPISHRKILINMFFVAEKHRRLLLEQHNSRVSLTQLSLVVTLFKLRSLDLQLSTRHTAAVVPSFILYFLHAISASKESDLHFVLNSVVPAVSFVKLRALQTHLFSQLYQDIHDKLLFSL